MLQDDPKSVPLFYNNDAG